MYLFFNGVKRVTAVVMALSLGAVLAFAATPSKTTKSKPSSASKISKKKTSHRASKKRGKARRSARRRGQNGIHSDRARQIQEALIREKYLEGEPSGSWDTRTQEAMRRYQADNGWQSKTVPDARALIKLGLGPDHSTLLNPETAATTSSELRAERDAPGGGGPHQ